MVVLKFRFLQRKGERKGFLAENEEIPHFIGGGAEGPSPPDGYTCSMGITELGMAGVRSSLPFSWFGGEGGGNQQTAGIEIYPSVF
jgi:hypothetical protein